MKIVPVFIFKNAFHKEENNVDKIGGYEHRPGENTVLWLKQCVLRVNNQFLK